MKKTKLLLITNAILVLSVAMFTSCKNAASGGDGERKFSLSNYEKTDFVTVIPKTTTIHMTDDSSWSAYYNGTDNNYKGVFIKDRKVQLSPYAMSAYQVTQELYEAVIGVNPSYFKGNSRQPATGEIQKYRPVEQVTWYDAVNFCNELTKKTMSEADCVYTITDIKKTNNRITNATVTIDISKKGYRLPTEAEWEFAARGGALTAPDWNCAYAGVQTLKSLGSFTNSPYYDEKLEEYGWYGYDVTDAKNNFFGTHEVGKKLPNSLELYDMSGNVYDWCYDKWDSIVTINDESYKVDDVVTNPLGSAFDSSCIIRGGCWRYFAMYCSVSYRYSHSSGEYDKIIGFRLARSL